MFRCDRGLAGLPLVGGGLIEVAVFLANALLKVSNPSKNGESPAPGISLTPPVPRRPESATFEFVPATVGLVAIVSILNRLSAIGRIASAPPFANAVSRDSSRG